MLVITVIVGLVASSCSSNETPSPSQSATLTTAASSTSATTTKATDAATTSVPAGTTTAITENKSGGTAIFLRDSSVNVFGVPWEIGGGVAGCWFPVCDPLIDQDGKGNYTPRLAESWTIAPDYLSITFNLRKDVLFHDGTPFNAQAVKWNWDHMMENGKSGSDKWASIEVLDDYTIKLNLKQWSQGVLTYLAAPESGAGFISPTAYEKEGVEYMRFHPVSTGPFMISESNRDSAIKYVRNPNYWQSGKPYLDAMEWRIVPDITTQALALRKGEADVLNITRGGYPDVKADLMKDGYTLATVVSGSGRISLAPDSANANSPLSIKEVREAIEYAIDKDAIASTMGAGVRTPVYQIAAKGAMGYNDALESEYRKYDVEKAKALLDQAGYSNGLTLNIYTESGFKDLATIIQAYCQEVGVTINVQIIDKAQSTELRQKGWENGFFLFSFATNPNFTQQIDWYFSEKIKDFVSTKRSDGNQEALEKALAATDVATQSEWTKKCVTIMFEDAMFIPVFEQGGDWVYSTKVLHDTGFSEGHINWWDTVNMWKTNN